MKAKNIIVILLILCVFLLFFTNAKEINSALKESLLFSINNVICSIFPFMMLSSIIINSYIIEKQLISLKINCLYKLGICKIYLPSILLGSVSGYVTGAKCIRDIYCKNYTDSTSLTNAIILSSNAGIGFVIVCIGMKIWNSSLFGIFLYLFQILTSLFIGRYILPKSNDIYNLSKTDKIDYLKSFTDAISSCAYSSFLIVSFIASFSVIITALTSLFPLSFRDTASSFLYFFLEFCNGSFKSVSFGNTSLCAFLTGFTAGFGGLCVHFQIFSVCSDLPLNRRLFVLVKLLHGIILGIISLALVNVLKITPSTQASVSLQGQYTYPISLITLSLILIGLVIKFYKSHA